MRAIHLGLISAALGLAGVTADPPEDPPAFWRVVERAVEKGGARAEFDALLEHMRGIDAQRARVGNRLSRVNTALREPWTPPALALDLQQLLGRPLTTRRGPVFGELAGGLASWLDLEGYVDPAPDSEHAGLSELDELWGVVANPELKGRALLEALSAFVGLSHTLLDESCAGLEPEERALLFNGYAVFYEAWYRDHFPGTQLAPEQADALAAFRSLIAKQRTDRRLLLGVASAALRLAEPSFLAGLPRRLARVGDSDPGTEFGEDVIATAGDEPSCSVVLAGKASSTHSAAAALFIDLGGDDTYTRSAVVDSPEQLASFVIDLGGDDTYRSAGPGPAFSAGGIALLIDRSGADEYISGRLGQAASVLGFAALVDLEGDDVYVAEDYAQGHAVCGIALLYDLEGDDAYTAWAFAQGGGIGNGVSALVDGEGSDRYLADLHWPDVYGNSGPDVYHGASQGYCTGMRPEVAGGIAALIDLGAGRDRYQAGSFSQGGGYYFSFGLMYDGGGDDENFGSRYAQGFGVHQAAGVRWDAGGDDSYVCRSVAHAGMAWDEGVGYLLEDGGDDVYATGDLSLGGAAQTGVAICIDRGGADVYRTGRQSQGGTGSSEYHDKPALGVLLDLGGKRDEYSAEERADSRLRVTSGVEVFLDSKARDPRKALTSRQLR